MFVNQSDAAWLERKIRRWNVDQSTSHSPSILGGTEGAVPVFIKGGHAAFPASKTMPRLRARVVVRIGSPETAERLGLKEGGNEDINRVADALRQRVMQLRDQSRQ